MHRQNRKNDGLDHCMPIPISNNNTNKNNGGNNTPYNGSYNQIYSGIPQSISPDMGGVAESMRDMRSYSPQSSGTPGSMANANSGMSGYSQQQMAGMQPMSFSGFQHFGQRPWMPSGPMGPPPGGAPGPQMYPYNTVPSYPPIYPPNPYGTGVAWNSPIITPITPTLPMEGYPNFNGDDFKILGYGGPNGEDPNGMNFPNSQNSGNGNSGRNNRMR